MATPPTPEDPADAEHGAAEPSAAPAEPSPAGPSPDRTPGGATGGPAVSRPTAAGDPAEAAPEPGTGPAHAGTGEVQTSAAAAADLEAQLARRHTLLQRLSVVLFVVAGVLVVAVVVGAVLHSRHTSAAGGSAGSSAGAGAAAGPAGGSSATSAVTMGGAGTTTVDPLGPVTDFPGTLLTTGPFAGFSEVAAQLMGPNGTVTEPCLLAAIDETHRERGLMHVTDRSLAGHAGMVFVYPVAQQEQFWMRNTPTPLAIAFYGADGRFVSGTTMAPCGDSASCPNYHAAGAYSLAVEVPRGQPLAAELVRGSTLRLTGECGTPSGPSAS